MGQINEWQVLYTCVCVCVYLAEWVSFIHVEATLHAHTRFPFQLPENQPTCMTLHCNTHIQDHSEEQEVWWCYVNQGRQQKIFNRVIMGWPMIYIWWHMAKYKSESPLFFLFVCLILISFWFYFIGVNLPIFSLYCLGNIKCNPSGTIM